MIFPPSHTRILALPEYIRGVTYQMRKEGLKLCIIIIFWWEKVIILGVNFQT